MSNVPQTTGRLDSLKGKKTPARPGAALKFKPKSVARRTKEERDADAPIVVPESQVPPPRHNSTRGRGGSRGRGGRNGVDRNVGTHIVSSGPLSSGFVSMESKKPASRSGISPSPTPEFIKSLRERHRLDTLSPSGSSTGSLGSDDEVDYAPDGDTKINMSLEYQFDSSRTELFPVRAVRSDHKDYGELHTQSSSKQSPAPEGEEDKEVNVKLEEESVVPLVTPESGIMDPINDDEVTLEKLRLANDYETIHTLMHQFNNKVTVSLTPDSDGDVQMANESDISPKVDSKSDFFFFQLPRMLPEFKSQKENDKVKDDVDTSEMKIDDDENNEIEIAKEVTSNDTNRLNGQIGHLRYHKSGKITMKLGNIIFDVSRGGDIGFIQEVVKINEPKIIKLKDENGHELIENEYNLEDELEIHHLGHILEKIVVIPKVDI